MLLMYFSTTLRNFQSYMKRIFKVISFEKDNTCGFEKMTKLHVHAMGNDWACQTIYFWCRKNMLNVSNSKTKKYKGFRLTSRIYLEVTSLKWKYFVAVLFKPNAIMHFKQYSDDYIWILQFLVYFFDYTVKVFERIFHYRIHWNTNYFIYEQLVKQNQSYNS